MNLFQLGMLETHGLRGGRWYGAYENGEIRGAVVIIPNLLVVPYGSQAACEALGERLALKHHPCMMVGPRAACDGLWQTWGEGFEVSRRLNQRLYHCTKASLSSFPPGFRAARPEEWETIAYNSARMEFDDLGRRPWVRNPRGFFSTIRSKIERRATWVLERDGEIVFQVNQGANNGEGIQVGGTYVPPEHRGKGYAKEGMAALCLLLLRSWNYVTLHVNEANLPAVKTYEGTGFTPYHPFRILLTPSDMGG